MRIGPLELEERLARGGMAEVWRGRVADGVTDGELRVASGVIPRDVVLCIKRLDPSVVADIDFVEMFRDEARLALAFDHENVVRTWALVDDNPGGQPTELMLVMELVDGVSLWALERALRRLDPPEPMTPTECLGVALQLARALHHVHTCVDDGAALQVVHRDVSPHNVIIGRDGRVVLIDFGVARAAMRLTRTRAGLLKGKAAYMAPEQARGEPVDARTDQFAWGIVLWEMLVGRHLFAGPDEVRVLSRVERSEVTPPSFITNVVGDLSVSATAVDDVVLRALSVNPADRFADMAAAATATAALLGRTPSLADLATRGLAAVALDVAPAAPAMRTRVVSTTQQHALAIEDTVPPPPRPAPSGVPVMVGAGAVLLLVLLLAIAIARPTSSPVVDGGPHAPVQTTTASQTVRTRAGALSERLAALPAHPCRLELEDELVRHRSLTDAIVDSIAADVDACTAAIAGADDARTALADLVKKSRRLVPRLPRSATAKARRLIDVKGRARLALDGGDVDAAVALAEAAAAQAPDDVDARRLLFDAYRRAGQVAAAGVEARALMARDDPDAERLTRWLADHDLPR